MSNTLPNWLERMLGAGPAGAGEGTAWSLDHSWRWAPWITLLFILIAAGGILFAYLHEAGDARRRYRITLAVIRLAEILLVMFMLAEVVLSLERTGLPYVVVAVDDSASMGIVDRYDDEKLRAWVSDQIKRAGEEDLQRLNVTKALLSANNGRVLHEIDRRYKLKLYLISETARPQSGTADELLQQIRDLEPNGSASRLGAGIRTILNDLRGTPPAAVVLLTDGVTTEGETLVEVANYAARKQVPLFTVAIGNDEPVRDLEVTDLLVDEVVFVDDIVNVDFKLTGYGFEGKQVEVLLRVRDQETPLAKATVPVGADGQPQGGRLTYRPTEVGEFDLVVEATPQDGELQAANNQEQCVISVRKEQIRVLLVQAYPNYEFRYLKNMLERDKTIELKTFLQEADPEYSASDKTALRLLPIRREAVFDFDVIVFGDVNPAFLSTGAMQNIADFVIEKGGGLVVTAGPRYTPLLFRDSPLWPLFPVEMSPGGSTDLMRASTDPFVPRPTEIGLTSPHMQLGDTPAETQEIWSHLPPSQWMLETPRLKPGAVVLAEHPSKLTPEGNGMPVIAMQYAGAGKVLYHAMDDTWRWRYRVGDVYFARYWVQAIRYLSRMKLLGKDRSAELTTDRHEYRRGDAVRLRVRFLDERQAPALDDGVTVVVEREGGQKQQLKLSRSAGYRGVFETSFTKAGDGDYHAWVAVPAMEGRPPSTDFLVVAPPGELGRTQIDLAELRRASEMTAGQSYTVRDAPTLLKDLPRGRQVPIETLPPVVLWSKWPLVLVFVGLLCSEWILRKRKGML